MTSGSDSASVQAVYDNLYASYLGRIPVHRTEILWTGPLFIALFAAVLIGFFFLLSFSLRHVGARKNRIHELTSFAGQLTERIGTIAVFSCAVWATIVAWAAYIAIKQALFGLIY